jgi:polysaccharide biosynthesis/export protein
MMNRLYFKEFYFNILKVLLISILTYGCATPSGKLLQPEDILTQNIQSKVDTYVLGIGDKIAVKLFYYEKLNDEVTVRLDGKISLQLIGEVKAAGLTPVQLAHQIVIAYAKNNMNINTSEVTVIVKEFASQNVYVGGEVARPGLVPLKGMVRSLDAVTMVGGVRDTANIENVVLIRYNGTQKPDVYMLDLNKVIRGEQPDILLKSYDIIFISKTTIAKVDLFVEQYFNKIIPSQIMFPYNLNQFVVR